MAKKYLVIALSVGSIGNKIYSSGETVTEDAFPEGHADKLVEDGFLQAIEEEEPAKATHIEESASDVVEGEEVSEPKSKSKTTKK